AIPLQTDKPKLIARNARLPAHPEVGDGRFLLCQGSPYAHVGVAYVDGATQALTEWKACPEECPTIYARGGIRSYVLAFGDNKSLYVFDASGEDLRTLANRGLDEDWEAGPDAIDHANKRWFVCETRATQDASGFRP